MASTLVTSENFESEIVNSPEVIAVYVRDMSGSGAVNSLLFGPVFDQVAAEYESKIKIYTLDLGIYPKAKERMPFRGGTIAAVGKGRILTAWSGTPTDTAGMRRFIDMLIENRSNI